MEPSNNAVALNDARSTPTPPSSEGSRSPPSTDHNVLLKDLHGRNFQTVNKVSRSQASFVDYAQVFGPSVLLAPWWAVIPAPTELY